MTFSTLNDHTNPIFKNIKLLKLSDILDFFNQSHSVSYPITRNSHLYYLPNFSSIKFGKNTLKYYGPQKWNVQNLDISRYSNEPFVNCIKDPTLKAIVKYRKHPSIIAIRNKYKNKNRFSFIETDKKEIEKEILNLDANKASQNSDIPIKILKENVDIFSDFVCNSFASSINMSRFPENLKLADITPLYKKGKKDVKGNYRPVSILPNLSKILKNTFLDRCHIFLTTYYQSINVALEKDSVPNIAF